MRQRQSFATKFCASQPKNSNCAEADLEIENGRVSIAGVRINSIGLGDLAKRANPLRGAVEPGTEPGLEATRYFGPRTGTTASGAHAVIVEVDPETMMLEI